MLQSALSQVELCTLDFAVKVLQSIECLAQLSDSLRVPLTELACSPTDVHIQMTRAPAKRSCPINRIRNSNGLDFAHCTCQNQCIKEMQAGGRLVLPNPLLSLAASSCCLNPPPLSLTHAKTSHLPSCHKSLVPIPYPPQVMLLPLPSQLLPYLPPNLLFTPLLCPHPRLMSDSVAPPATFQTPFILCRVKYRTKTAPPHIRNIMY